MNIQEMMRQAQKLQGKLKKVQEEIEGRSFEGTAGGGMVTATVNGRREVKSLAFEKEVVNPEDIEMLQDLVVAALNQALAKAEETMKTEVEKLTGGMGVPGMF